MRRLIPSVRDEDLDDLYLEPDLPDPPEHRPHLYLDMVASADGAATIRGRTGELGSEADRLAFSRLRGWCDAVLVGAETVRIEDYGPPRPTETTQRRREAHGLAAVPPLVVVTASCRLEPDARLFSDATRRPIVLTVEDADRRAVSALREVADVRMVGHGRVDLSAAMGHLREDGIRHLLCEGGPTLNGELIRLGLVDELFLTMTPQIVGSSPRRIVEGAVDHGAREVELVELREHDGELLLRYRFPEGAGW